jgi:hypothetical protein
VTVIRDFCQASRALATDKRIGTGIRYDLDAIWHLFRPP